MDNEFIYFVLKGTSLSVRDPWKKENEGTVIEDAKSGEWIIEISGYIHGKLSVKVSHKDYFDSVDDDDFEKLQSLYLPKQIVYIGDSQVNVDLIGAKDKIFSNGVSCHLNGCTGSEFQISVAKDKTDQKIISVYIDVESNDE